MQKKLVSSVFIALILLNVVGYYGIFMVLQYNHAQQMMSRFDAGQYEKDDAQILKIPYPSDYSSESFVRVDGDFKRNGQIYRLIKQRLYRDTFHIVYMEDKKATAINQSLELYVKTFSENSQDDNHQTPLPVLIREYFPGSFLIEQKSIGYQQNVVKQSPSIFFIDSFMSSIVHPPERV